MWILLIFVVVCFIVGDVLVKKSKLGLIFKKKKEFIMIKDWINECLLVIIY